MGTYERPLTILSILVLLLLVASSARTTDECPMNVYEPAPEGFHLENDILCAGNPERRYMPSQYRRRIDGPGYEVCSCVQKPCVKKCCKPGKVYVNNSYKCSVSNETHERFAVPMLVTENGTVETYANDQFHIVYGQLKCIDNASTYRLTPSSDVENIFVSKNGSLFSESGLFIAQPGQFCLEQFFDLEFHIAYMVCSIQPKKKDINIYYIFSMILSLPFLFVTFLVYALIKKLRNLHGKSLMCHVISLFVAYSSLILGQLHIKTAVNDFCVILAYIIQFSFLASFFWLNVMCFDLWWTFSEHRPLGGQFKQPESKKFIIYSIYAWGCTSLISLFTYYMHQPPFMGTYNELYPGFGENSCWFSSTPATVFYFYGPIALILISNLLMFMYTAVMIYKKIKDATVFNQTDCNKNIDHEKQRFVLYLNLFVVMGVNWLAEIISFAFEENVEAYIWYITDFGNALQGVFIFLIFVCKKRVFKLMNEQLCPRLKLSNITTVLNRNFYNSSIISKSQYDLEVNARSIISSGAITSYEQNTTNDL